MCSVDSTGQAELVESRVPDRTDPGTDTPYCEHRCTEAIDPQDLSIRIPGGEIDRDPAHGNRRCLGAGIDERIDTGDSERFFDRLPAQVIWPDRLLKKCSGMTGVRRPMNFSLRCSAQRIHRGQVDLVSDQNDVEFDPVAPKRLSDADPVVGGGAAIGDHDQ